jgi:hypothetical protein
MPTKLTAKDVLNIRFDDMKSFDRLVENLRESPYAKKGNSVNPGKERACSSEKIQEYFSDRVLEKPYRISSESY